MSGKFVLLSTHTKDGAGHFYTYTPENKLATFADASGRTMTVAWAGKVIASIAWPTGSVRYRYAMADSAEDLQLPGTERSTLLPAAIGDMTWG